MSTPDFFHAEHRKRLRKIWANALSSIVGICCSLLSIYWTVTHGLPFKAYLLDGAARTVVVLTAAIYILAQLLALAHVGSGQRTAHYCSRRTVISMRYRSRTMLQL